jgi:hypothetical protein
MTYKLEKFGTTNLPIYRPTTPIGTGGSNAPVLDLPGGGVWDPLGSEDARRKSTTIRYKGALVESTATALDTAYKAWEALRGTADILYRRRADTTMEWCQARLVQVDGSRGAENLLHQDFSLTWQMISDSWYSHIHDGGWLLDAGYYLDAGLYLDSADFTFTLDASPKSCTVTNGGNVLVENCVITVTCGVTAAITALTIERAVGGVTQEKWAWAGTIATSKALVIDVGTWSVLNDGVDAFAITLDATHKSDVWLKLLPGANTITVTLTGGSTNSTILFTFADGEA